MDALPYYKWHWQDWRANRRVQRMPWQAKGPYRELLDEFWAEGSLPTEMHELADIVGCTTEELTDLWVHIGPCWEERNGRLYNSKMDEQRTVTDKARVAMANGGFRGGKASNSHTRANPKPTLEVPEAKPDIEEKRREEKSKEEQKPSRGKREIDPRHVLFRLACETYAKHKGVTFVWDASEAKQLALLLAAAPDLTVLRFQACLNNRARSPAVVHSERPRLWMGNVLSFEQGPLNQFRQPEGTGNGTSKGKSGQSFDAGREALEIISRNLGFEHDGDTSAGPKAIDGGSLGLRDGPYGLPDGTH